MFDNANLTLHIIRSQPFKGKQINSKSTNERQWQISPLSKQSKGCLNPKEQSLDPRHTFVHFKLYPRRHDNNQSWLVPCTPPYSLFDNQPIVTLLQNVKSNKVRESECEAEYKCQPCVKSCKHSAALFVKFCCAFLSCFHSTSPHHNPLKYASVTKFRFSIITTLQARKNNY